MTPEFTHKGKIIEISGNRIDVLMDENVSCTGCKAKRLCGMEDDSRKVFSVDEPYPGMYANNETVEVVISKTMGHKAVLLAYVFPFLVMLCSLLTLNTISDNELITALGSLGLTAVYYLILYFFRNKLQREIKFKLKKYNG